jgi:hypothetical protein
MFQPSRMKIRSDPSGAAKPTYGIDLQDSHRFRSLS